MNTTEYYTAIVNTVLVIGLSIAVAVPIGVALAMFLLRTNVIGRQLVWIGLGSQLAVPLYVFAGGWNAGFGMQGWFTALGPQFDSLAFLAAPRSTGALLAVALIHAFSAIPWVALITALGLMWTDRSQEELAILDGGWSNVMGRLLIPKLRIWIVASVLWCTIPIMTEMTVSNLYQVSTVAEQVYLDASRGGVSPMTYVAAVIVCMLPIAIGLIVVAWRSVNWADILFRASHFRGRSFDLERQRVVVSVLVWAVVATFVGLPIFSLIAKAGWQPVIGIDGLTHYGWSLGRFATTCSESLTLFGPEFYWSTALASVSSLLAFVVGIVLYAFGNRSVRWGVSLSMMVAIAVPGPLVGMLVIWCMNRTEPSWMGFLYDRTLAAPVLAQQFRLLPVAWVLICVIMASIARSTREQAEIDRLGRLGMLTQVILPQTAGRWLVALMLLFVLSFGELSCSILVLPPGVTTISMRLFEMLHFGMRHQDSGLCGVLMLLGWGVSLAFWNTLRER